MGHRLTRIYTRTGDDGTTGLGDGERVAKDSLRVECMGEVDELNALLGRVLVHPLPAAARECLIRVQSELFELGGELCLPGLPPRMQASMVTRLEQELDGFNASLAPLKEFILPGGTPAATETHVARTVCRRVERRLVTLMHQEGGNADSRHYVNRLSDLLFVLARWLNHAEGQSDVLWVPR